MKRLKTSYFIDNKKYTFPCNVNTFKGKNEVLINNGDNLLEKSGFNNKGYKIVNFKKYFSHTKLIKYINKYLENIIKKKINLKIKNFKIQNYHLYIDQNNHFKVLKELSSGIKFSKNFFRKKIEKLVSDSLGIKVTTLNKKYKKQINPNVFFLRIVRPTQYDFNPPHRDVYFKRYQSAVNIYIPIIGSNKKSSLPIFPGSHLLNESHIERTDLNSSFNNFKFSVPIVIKTSPKLKLVRPNPKKNNLMIFSSYLIHGGAKNENKNTTRVSIELRFWKAK